MERTRRPRASFTTTCTGLSCSFTDASSDSDGNIASRSWTFGDGGTSAATNPTHGYPSAGTYTVKLTVTDDGGATASITKSVTVTAGSGNVPPTADFTATCTGLSCAFTDESSDSDGRIPVPLVDVRGRRRGPRAHADPHVRFGRHLLGEAGDQGQRRGNGVDHQERDRGWSERAAHRELHQDVHGPELFVHGREL